MTLEISIEEIEQAVSKTIGKRVSIEITREPMTDDDVLKVFVKERGEPTQEVYKLTSNTGNIWKKFLVWSVADGFVKMSNIK